MKFFSRHGRDRTRVAMALVLVATTMGVVAGVAACLDMSPNNFVPAVQEAEPPPIVDAGPDVPDVDMRPPCEQCIESPDQPGPGCADELAACRADPRCNATYDCVIAHSCLTRGSQRRIILCGLPCAQDAGIIAQDDPAAVLVLAVVACLQTACPSECKITDAGTD